MSIFAKKPEWEQKVMADVGSAPQIVPKTGSGKGGSYGIAEAIQLLRSLPAEQSSELVVRVVRATLASLDVHLADIVEDATRKQKHLADRMASEHAQIAELERQLETRRREVAALEADLKETTSVKERLQQADKTAVLAGGGPRAPRHARRDNHPHGWPRARPDLRRDLRPAAGHTPGPELLARAAREGADGSAEGLSSARGGLVTSDIQQSGVGEVTLVPTVEREPSERARGRRRSRSPAGPPRSDAGRRPH